MDQNLQSIIDTPEFRSLTEGDRNLVIDQFFHENYGDQIQGYSPEDQSLIREQFFLENDTTNGTSETFGADEDEGLLKTAGKGLIHGALSIPEAVATGFEYGGRRLGMDTLAEHGAGMKQYWQEKAEPFKPPPDIQGNIWDNPELLKNTRWWLYNIPQIVPSMAMTLVPGVTAGRIAQATGLAAKYGDRAIKLARATGFFVGGGSLEAASTYNAVLQEGGSEEEAARSAEFMFFGTGILNALGAERVLRVGGDSFMAKVASRLGAGVAEGITEGAEEPWETFSRLAGKYLAGEELPDAIAPLFIESLKEGLTVAPIAGVTGVGASLFGGQQEVASPDQNEVPPPPPPPSRRTDGTELKDIETEHGVFSDEADAKRQDIIDKEATGAYDEYEDRYDIADEIFGDKDAQDVPGSTDQAGDLEEETPIDDLVQQAEEEIPEPAEKEPEAPKQHYAKVSIKDVDFDYDAKQGKATVKVVDGDKSLFDKQIILSGSSKGKPEADGKRSITWNGHVIPGGENFDPRKIGQYEEVFIETDEPIEETHGDFENAVSNNNVTVEGRKKKDTPESLAKEFGVKYQGEAEGLHYFDIELGREKPGTIATAGLSREKLQKAIRDAEKQFEEIKTEGVHYHSGAAANINDLKGMIDAGEPLSISLDRATANHIEEAVKYAGQGGKVLVDSGAFTAFNKDLEMEWDDVVGKYNDIVDRADGNVSLIAPDVIGDQSATYDLLRDFKDDINGWIERGADVVVPLQKGESPPFNYWQAVARTLQNQNFRLGIPSNKKRFTIEDLKELFSPDNPFVPNKVHLLGMGPASNGYQARIDLLKELSPGIDITSDATTTRRLHSEISDQSKEGLEEDVDRAFDDTELPYREGALEDESVFAEDREKGRRKTEKEEKAKKRREAVASAVTKKVKKARKPKSDKPQGEPKDFRAWLKQNPWYEGDHKGEFKELPIQVRFTKRLSSKGGIHWQDIRERAISEGWMDPNEDWWEALRDPDRLRHGKVGGEATTDFQKEQEKERFAEYEPTEPPEGEYVEVKAEDLPEGKELTILGYDPKDGWDEYRVIDKDPFGVTLLDGVKVELAPLEEVSVLKKDLEGTETPIEEEKKESVLSNPDIKTMLDSFYRRNKDVFETPSDFYDDTPYQLAMQLENDRDTYENFLKRFTEDELDLEAEIHRYQQETKEATQTDPGQKAEKKRSKFTEGRKKTAPAKSTKSDPRIPRFRKMADTLDKQIEDKRREMTQNPTPKRMKEYRSRMHDADNLEREQRAFRAIADALEEGNLPEILNGLKTKGQIRPLVRKGLTGGGGYYDVIPSDEYADTSEKGKALQSLMEGGLSEEQIKAQETRDAARELKDLEESVRFSKIPGFFPTPKPVIETMLDYADIGSTDSVLEPSAGKGDIADAIKERFPGVSIETIERQHTLRKILEAKGYELLGDDFLEHEGQYDRIIQNPPFEKGQDIDHVRHAYEQLKPGGRLVSVMSPSPFFNSQKKAKEFREWFEEVGGEKHDLGQAFKGVQAFRQTGTSSVVVVIEKPALPEKTTRSSTNSFTRTVEDATNKIEFYYKGDKAVFTGETEVLHGGLFAKAKLLEGHRKGDLVDVSIKDKETPSEPKKPTLTLRREQAGRTAKSRIEGPVVRKKDQEGLFPGDEARKNQDLGLLDPEQGNMFSVPKKGASVSEIQYPILKDPPKGYDPRFKKPDQLNFDFTIPENLRDSDVPPPQRTRMVTTGNILAAGSIVQNAGDAASLLSHIRKSAQEVAYTVTVDKDGAVLEVHKYTKGLRSSSQISPVEVAGRVLNIPDASKVYFVHSHPSGVPGPSPEDVLVYKPVAEILSLNDTDMEAIVLGGTQWQGFNEMGATGPVEKIRPQIKKVPIPEKERQLSQTSEFAKLATINNQNDAAAVLKDRYGSQDGILFLTAKNKITDFLPWPKGLSYKAAAAKIMGMVEKSNSSAAIINLNEDLSKSQNRTDFIVSLLGALDTNLQVHDIHSAGKSYAETGALAHIKRLARSQTGRAFGALRSGPILYATKQARKPIYSLTPDMVRSLSFVRNARVMRGRNNEIRVRFPNGRGFTIESVNSISPNTAAFTAAYGKEKKPITGSYDHRSKKIEVSRGIGDQWTISHEFEHFLEKSGMLSALETQVLDNHANRNLGRRGMEARAEMVERALRDRALQRQAGLGRVIQKIRDIIDQIINLFVATGRGVVRTIESGKVMERPFPFTEGDEAVEIQYSVREPIDDSGFSTKKDIWIGRVNLAKAKHNAQTRDYEDRLKEALGKKKFDQEAQDWEAAIHIYLDLKRNPDHLNEYWNDLTPEWREIVRLSTQVEDNPGILKIADDIHNEYVQLGETALEAGVIRNVIDNYAARIWKPKKKHQAPADLYKKFNRTSRHSLPRVFETILEGLSKKDTDGNPEYELMVKGAFNNLEHVKNEIVQTIENRNLHNELAKLNYFDTDEKMLTWDPPDHIEYEKIQHPGFNFWHPFSTTKGGFSKDYVVTEDGRKIRLGRNAFLQKRFAVVKKGQARAVRVLDTFKMANLYMVLAKKGDAQGQYDIEERVTGWERRDAYAPKEIAQRLNRMIGVSKIRGGKIVDTVTKYNAFFKNMILITGLFHHQAFLRSYYLPTEGLPPRWNPIRAYKEGAKAIREQTKDPDSPLSRMIYHNLTFGRMQDWQEDILQQEDTVFGRALEKAGAGKFRDKLVELRDRQATFLFQNFGAGLKAMAALHQYRRMTQRHPDLEPDEIAKMVASLINDDFGGLHLQSMERDPTRQHFARLMLLAPDWTESNVRSMIKAFRAGSKEETAMYRRFWANAIVKGMGATVAASILLSMWDEDDPVERFKKAWGAGNLRWFDLDVTPLYQSKLYRSMAGFFGEEPHPEKRKYMSLIGHFRDPIKFILKPVRSLHHKGSVLYRVFHEAMGGTDWKGEKFTHWRELIGQDKEKGYYLSKTKTHKFGDPKWGKLSGKTVSYRSTAKGGPVGYDQVPSYLLSQAKGMMPIQVQQLVAWTLGEVDAWDAWNRSLGMHTMSTYPSPSKDFKRFVKEYKGLREAKKPTTGLRKKVKAYNEKMRARGEAGIPWAKITKRAVKALRAERVGQRRLASNQKGTGLLNYSRR